MKVIVKEAHQSLAQERKQRKADMAEEKKEKEKEARLVSTASSFLQFLLLLFVLPSLFFRPPFFFFPLSPPPLLHLLLFPICLFSLFICPSDSLSIFPLLLIFLSESEVGTEGRGEEGERG